MPVANGTLHGRGVYTAVGPRTSMQYGGGAAGCVVLARALPGECLDGRGEGHASVDSWRPCGDWLVFRSGAQLLPVYAVHFDASRC